MLSQKKAMSKGVPPFTPDARQCLILGNYEYSPIRFTKAREDGNLILDSEGNPKKFGFSDLNHVEADLQLFREKVSQYGFDDLDIVTKENLNMAQIKSTFASYRKRINANADVGRKTLTVVYYGGHGM